ncbi:MAG: DMT family transporter, partial [Gemmatimonadota bacterium]
GMDRTRAGNASLLLASTPIFTALWSVLAGHERSDPRVWGGAAATLLGMALVIGGGEAGFSLGGETVAGDLLMAGSSIVWSIYTVAARRPMRRYGSIAVTAWTLWIGTAGLVLIGLPAVADTPWRTVSRAAWGSVLYAGMLGIGVAYLLWYHGVNRLGSTRTAVWANAVPVLALIVAWIWLGEVPTPWQIGGAAVIIGGLRLARHRRHEQSRAPAGERLLRS